MAYQELWVDPSVADGGTGTYANPYSRQDLAITAATASECVVNLKRGHVYAPFAAEAATLRVNGKSPAGYFRIRPYGDAETPPMMFAGHCMMPGDSGWVYVGDGLWSKPMTDNSGYTQPGTMRLYVGESHPTGAAVGRSLGTGYSFGKAIARYAVEDFASQAEVLAEVGEMGLQAPRLWTYTETAAGGNGILYVWTGRADQDPPTFYGGITLVGTNGLYDANGFGRLYGITTYNSSRLHFEGIASIFGQHGIKLGTSSGTPCSDLGLINCQSLAFAGNGILIEGGGASAIMSDSFAHDCLVDAVATLDEDWNFRQKAGTIGWIPGTQDATVIGRYTTNALLDRVTTRDGYHSNVYVGSTFNTPASNVVNARIIDCVSTQTNRAYGALLGGAQFGVSQVVHVQRFRGSDAVSFIGKTGSGKWLIEDSEFKDAKRPYTYYDANSPLGCNLIPGISVLTNTPFGACEAGSIVLNRCTISQPYGFAIEINEGSFGVPMPAGLIELNDTLLIDTRYLNSDAARTYNPGTYDKGGISFSMRATATVGVMVSSNSYCWTGQAGQPRVATNNTVEVTFAAWTGLSGTLIEADPRVSESNIPLVGSPLLGAGTSLAAPCRDVTGKQRPLFYPSVGAHDVATLRKVDV